MNTEIACKISGSKDPRKPRSCFLADREGMDAVPEHGKKWLASFLAKVPPDTTWGKVQAASDRGPGPPDPPTSDRTANAKPAPRRPWTAGLARLSCGRRETRDTSRETPAEEAVETTG